MLYPFLNVGKRHGYSNHNHPGPQCGGSRPGGQGGVEGSQNPGSRTSSPMSGLPLSPLAYQLFNAASDRDLRRDVTEGLLDATRKVGCIPNHFNVN